MKKSILKILRKMGFDVKPFNIHTSNEALMKKILSDNNVDLVIDIGANIGQYALGLIDLGYTKDVFSIEPISKAYEVCKKRSKRHSNWDVHKIAAGEEDGKKTLYLSKNSLSSSFLKMKKIHIDAEPDSYYIDSEEVSMFTLDTIYKKYSLDEYQRVFLKMDIQGYEKNVLKNGLSSIKKNVKFIEIELSFVELYEESPLYDEMISFLKSNGFEFFTITPDFRDDKSGKLLQANGIFINEDLLKSTEPKAKENKQAGVIREITS